MACSNSGNDVILTNTYDDKAKWSFTATGSNWFIENKWKLDNNQISRLKFANEDVSLASSGNGSGTVKWREIFLGNIQSKSAISKETNNSNIDTKVYPNPSDGTITVSFGKLIENGTWKITNNLGQLVSEGTITNKNTMEISVDQSQGLYFLSIISEDGMNTMPILIKK